MGTAHVSRWKASGAVLGIDLSPRRTALSIYTAGGHHQRCISIDLPLARGSKKDPPIPEIERIRRCLKVANEIVKVMELFNIRHVGIEGYAYDAKHQAHQIGEVAGVVKSQIWLRFRIVPRIFQPSAARSHVFGYGGSVSKDEVMSVVRDGLGIEVANDHEADATVIARCTFDTVVAEEKEARA